MTLDFSSLEKALVQLKTSRSYLLSESAEADAGLREQFRAACIQGFEFTYELAIRMIRRQLELMAASKDSFRELHFLDQMREAFAVGLIEDPQDFRLFREMRNLTSHTYDADRAEEVLSILDSFISSMDNLIISLNKHHGK